MTVHMSSTPRGQSQLASKTITLTANAGAQSLNCFQVTGTVEICKLYALVVDTGTFVNCTGAHFETDDGAAQSDITKNDGVLSGMAVGTYMAKNALAAVTMAVANNATAVLTEQAADKEAFQAFVVTQKTAANTYIRFTYATTDAPIDAQILVFAEYKSVEDGISALVAV